METTGFHLLGELLKLALWLSLPVLAAALVSGLCSGAFQGATAISDQSLSTVPRLLAGGLTLLLCGPWIMRQLVAFTLALLGDLGRFAH
jgi:flagellar biosynthetic protein FliQ